MTNNEIVESALVAMGEGSHHRAALVFAISRKHTVAEALASQLVDGAIADQVIVIDALGMVRKPTR